MCEWGIKSPTIIVLLFISPFILVSICLLYWTAPMLGAYIYIYIYIYMLYLLFGLILWSLGSVFVSFHSLYFSLFYLIWVLLLLLSFGLHLHEISFPTLSLSLCMCPLFSGGSLLDSIYRGLVFVSIQPSLCLLVGAFNLFTFKVIIDKYDFTAIYFGTTTLLFFFH